MVEPALRRGRRGPVRASGPCARSTTRPPAPAACSRSPSTPSPTSTPNAHLEVYGQELNPETWAIARSDLMITGSDPSRMELGNTLTEDRWRRPALRLHAREPALWRGLEGLRRPHPARGRQARAGTAASVPACPASRDGSMLFLLHMISKFKPVADDPKTPWVDGGYPHGHRAVRQSRSSPAPPGQGSRRSGAGSSRATCSRASSRCRTRCSTTPASPPTCGSSPTGSPTTASGQVVLVDARDLGTKMRKSPRRQAQGTHRRRHRRDHRPVRQRARGRRPAGEGHAQRGVRLRPPHRRAPAAPRVARRRRDRSAIASSEPYSRHGPPEPRGRHGPVRGRRPDHQRKQLSGALMETMAADCQTLKAIAKLSATTDENAEPRQGQEGRRLRARPRPARPGEHPAPDWLPRPRGGGPAHAAVRAAAEQHLARRDPPLSSPTPGSTTARPRSATRSLSPVSSTSTLRRDPSPRSESRSRLSKLQIQDLDAKGLAR